LHREFPYESSEKQKILGNPRRRYEDNIKMDIVELAATRWFVVWLIFYPEEGGDTFLRKAGS
jgi:hypothetical protein